MTVKRKFIKIGKIGFEAMWDWEKFWIMDTNTKKGLLSEGRYYPLVGIAKGEYNEMTVYNLHLVYLKLTIGWLNKKPSEEGLG